jgi:HSP20 family protein
MSSRWEPFDQLTSLRDAMSRLMDQSFIFSGRGQAEGSAQSIPVNVFETDEVLMVVAPVPGLQQEDIEITARGNTLTIEGRERADLKPESPKRYLRHEWRYGPYAVDPSTAEATMGNGVLTIRLTKAATERSHKISVKTGA